MTTPIGPNPITLRLAQSYGVLPRPQVRPAQGVAPAAPAVAAKATGPVQRVVATVVPGKVDFSGDTPRPSTEGLPLYRHPADRNAAATGVQAGRVIVGRLVDAQG